MPERKIIARAQTAGTRRLVALPPLEGPAPVDLPDAPATGRVGGMNAFLDAARRQGAELIAVAREQAETIAANAREQGFAAGYEEGTTRAEGATAELLAFADSCAREARDHRERSIAACERDIVLLALDVAGRIAGGAIEAEPDRVVEVLRGALRRTSERRSVTVICNPADLDRLRSAGPDLAATLGGLRELDLLGDRRVERGGVVVRTAAGDVDATLASQLERLRQGLLEEDPGAAPEEDDPLAPEDEGG